MVYSCVWGYHTCGWAVRAPVGKVLDCSIEIDNDKDRYAAAVIKGRIGYLQKKSSQNFFAKQYV